MNEALKKWFTIKISLFISNDNDNIKKLLSFGYEGSYMSTVRTYCLVWLLANTLTQVQALNDKSFLIFDLSLHIT